MSIHSAFQLPHAPAHLTNAVKAWSEPVVLPTYQLAPAQKNPMFLENRVYQGSSGRIYPLPFIERVAQQSTPRRWQAVHVENEYLRLMILPEIGGRIHVGLDKTNGYDFFYRQNVIKPALVGLAGPWISGGVEFNWPQHHRPATYMPVLVTLEPHDDGSATVWCGDHDPLERLKAAHGICLHPGKAFVELKVRLYNRTPFTQTFLWWANVAVPVSENYQSFFPPDVHFVADHAKRAVSRYSLSESTYYGIDYGARAASGVPENQMPARFRPRNDVAPNDLSWYSNIPVPTSYMAIGSRGDFFGGYDHGRQAGLVHVANHHISPGKKQWTWGNGEFGYAWERNLTDEDGPYIELMAGVYTDNQPDFSFLAPGETKTFQQYWFPIQQIGVPQKANEEAAIRVAADKDGINVGVCVTARRPNAEVMVSQIGSASRQIASRRLSIAPGAPTEIHFDISPALLNELRFELLGKSGQPLLSYEPREFTKQDQSLPEPATEPPAPHDIRSVDELFLTGLHLSQYRHATRSPEPYWREALKRDCADSRCNDALGMWHLRRGEFDIAAQHFQTAIARLTTRNPNPSSGDSFFHLGLALRFLGRDPQAYDAFYKSIWNFGTRACGYHALAELDVKSGRWTEALQHLQLSLDTNAGNTNARNLGAIVLRILDRIGQAEAWTAETLKQDVTDVWAQYLRDGTLPDDNQTCLDLAFDYTRAGLYAEACTILKAAWHDANEGSLPIIFYALASFCEAQGLSAEAQAWRKKAQQASSDYCFPNRLEELLILKHAIAQDANDAMARYYLGTLLYDRKRYAEAIEAWEAATDLGLDLPTLYRNLGIAYYNVQDDSGKARTAFDRAIALDPNDARIFYERDQLSKRVGVPASVRMAEFERNQPLVTERDDLSAELAGLYQQTGRYEDSLAILQMRHFQPWEGGEGLAIGQHVRTNVAMGRQALITGCFKSARRYFEAALSSPDNLGEAKHVLVNYSHVYYWLGVANHCAGDESAARKWWEQAAVETGDFQEMSVRTFSEMSYYRALALDRLSRGSEADRLAHDLLHYAEHLGKSEPKIDYFATSLPAMLLFREDLRRKSELTAAFLSAQALNFLGNSSRARDRLQSILAIDPNHALAADFLVEMEQDKLLRARMPQPQ